MRADHGSHLVTIYMGTEMTWKMKRKREEKKKRKEKEKYKIKHAICELLLYSRNNVK